MARPYRTRDDERDVFRALAHPVRRSFLAAALDRVQSFEQLQALAHRSNATVASHLRILREARLLTATRTGHSVNYRVNKQALRSSARWLTEIAQVAAPANGAA